MIVFCAMFTLLPPGSASKIVNNCSMRGFSHFHVCGSLVFNDNTRGIFVWEMYIIMHNSTRIKFTSP